MTKRLNVWLLALVVIVGLPYYWLLVDDRTGPVEAHPLSIRQLRELAGSVRGEAPLSITYETLGGRNIPRGVLAAGQGLTLLRFSARAYRIDVQDSAPVMIDSGLSAHDAMRSGLEPYRKDKQELVDAELRRAQLVITLGDDALHSGGIRMLGIEPASRKINDPKACPAPRALAPGIVDIPICDKVIASRMVYVRLLDGREFLMMGDIAPTTASVWRQAGPSRLMDSFGQKQDGNAIHGWLTTIVRLKKQAPQLILISGHSPVPENNMPRGFPLQ